MNVLPAIRSTIHRIRIRNWGLGLRAKFIIVMVFVFVPVFALTAMGIWNRAQRRELSAIEMAQRLSSGTASSFQSYLHGLWNVELALGSALSTSGSTPPRALSSLLREQAKSNLGISEFVWNPVKQSQRPEADRLNGLAAARQSCVSRAIRGEEEIISDSVVAEGQEPIVVVARAIRQDDVLQGIVSADVRLREAWPQIVAKKGGPYHICLFDGQSRLVIRNDPIMEIGGAPPRPMAHAHNAGSEPQFGEKLMRDGCAGDSRLQTSTRVAGTGWRVNASVPQAEVMIYVYQDAIRDFLLLLGLGIVYVFFTILFGKMLLRRIHSLQRAALAVSQGDLTARAGACGCDELGQACAAFDRMVARLDHLEAERIRFLQVTAHELRNPMASIKGICALLRHRAAAGPPLELVPKLTIVEHEVDRLAYLLDEVLEAFRMQEGHLSLRIEPIDLVQVLNSALRPFRQFSSIHRFEISEPGRPVVVLGDDRRLEDVLRNLLSNAIKYWPEGGTIRIFVHVIPCSAIVAINDHGFGIPPDQLTRVFDPFYRGTNLAGRDPGGIGLGLYICRDIVERHGGRIWAESSDLTGTTFYVELPLKPEK